MDTFDYYQFVIPEDAENNIYEIVLTPKSGGNPDIVISMDPYNKFPTRDNHDYISENEFSTDQITIDQVMIDRYLERA
jgi:hypothetical protein